jgi:hypothetical protein
VANISKVESPSVLGNVGHGLCMAIPGRSKTRELKRANICLIQSYTAVLKYACFRQTLYCSHGLWLYNMFVFGKSYFWLYCYEVYTPACFRRFVSDKEGLVSLIKVIDQFHVEFTMNEMYRTLCNCLKDSCLSFLHLLLVSTVLNDVKTSQPRPFYAKFSIHYCLRN